MKTTSCSWKNRTPLLPLACLLACGLSGSLAFEARAQSGRVVITSQPAYSITWDGNNGGFSNPEPGASAPDNLALASKGVTTFGSSAFLPGGIHDWVNVNDGFYGNGSSWISDFRIPDPNPFVGLVFGKTLAISSIAWSRDNGDDAERAPAGPYTDRAVGTYTLQVTAVASPSVDTAQTDDPATGWATIGTVEYKAGADTANFSAYLRHRFDVATGGNPIPATGVRIKVSDGNIDLDEIEINPPPDPIPPISTFLAIANNPGYLISWDLNNGTVFSPDKGAGPNNNIALAANGTVAFGSSEVGLNTHFIANVNDGLYGNSHSWIPKFTDPPDTGPFIGLKFKSAIALKSIAWSRDNGDNTESACGGQCTDRALGLYTLQITRVADPGVATPETEDAATGWATVGVLNYKSDGTPFATYLRHRFELATTNGAPLVASGLRLKLSSNQMAIDEIEVNVHAALEQNLSESLLIESQPGYSITWDGNDGDFYSPNAGARAPNNLALAATGTAAFGSSELGFGVHFIRTINDGFYGNSHSWISDRGVGGGTDDDPFVGLNFGKLISIDTIAWGRDNGDTTEGGCGGTCTDRSIGIYTFQVTTVTAPGVATADTGDPATGWATIGTIEYKSAAPPGFNPSLRHAYAVAKGASGIPATGLRIKVSSGDRDIDEIEVNPTPEVVAPPISDLIAIKSSAGYSIAWDGNDGDFNNPLSNAAAPNNLALASRGTVAFGSSQVDLGVHFIANINDGLYGNKNSWIPKFTDPPDNDPFIGLNFGKSVAIRSIAWSRDNGNVEGDCCGGTLNDRAVGTYTLQITTAASPGSNTPEAANPAAGWVTIGTLEYKAGFATLFNPHLRHKFDVSAGGSLILATGIRIKVSSNQMDLDEIEVNPNPKNDENILVIQPEAGYAIGWDGNNGDYNNPNAGAAAPDNLALASRGAVAFGSSQLDFGVHFITNINNGLYGNKNSWIADFSANPDSDPYIGVKFGKTVLIENVAWGRDNGDDTEGPANSDRSLGIYTLQVTTLTDPGIDTTETADPATGWATIGSLNYRGGDTSAFKHYLRHSYELSRDGKPIPATAFRLKVSSNGIAIDEIEVNPQLPTPVERPVLTFSLQGGDMIISWTGTGTLQFADKLPGPWNPLPGSSPQTVSTTAGPQRFFRVQQ